MSITVSNSVELKSRCLTPITDSTPTIGSSVAESSAKKKREDGKRVEASSS